MFLSQCLAPFPYHISYLIHCALLSHLFIYRVALSSPLSLHAFYFALLKVISYGCLFSVTPLIMSLTSPRISLYLTLFVLLGFHFLPASIYPPSLSLMFIRCVSVSISSLALHISTLHISLQHSLTHMFPSVTYPITAFSHSFVFQCLAFLPPFQCFYLTACVLFPSVSFWVIWVSFTLVFSCFIMRIRGLASLPISFSFIFVCKYYASGFSFPLFNVPRTQQAWAFIHMCITQIVLEKYIGAYVTLFPRPHSASRKVCLTHVLSRRRLWLFRGSRESIS